MQRHSRERVLAILSVLLFLSLAGLPAVLAQQPPMPPEEPPGHVLVDDMWLPADVVYGDSVFTPVAWPNGIVHYAFDPAVPSGNRALFEKALAEIEATASITFVPWSGSQPNFILVRQNPLSSNVSNSRIGMTGGPQFLNVGSNHWNLKYVLVHELFHALGFLHEQSRPDRDQYVTINWPFISQTGCSGNPCNGNFTIVGVPAAVPIGPYDFLSIMHYGQFAFTTVPGIPTIICRPGYEEFQNQIGNGTFMTSLDARGVAAIYGAPSQPTVTSLSPSSSVAGSAGVWVTITGTKFLEGSPNTQGVQGTVALWNNTPLMTIWTNKNMIEAWVPATLLTTPGVRSISVRNDPDAGGPSASGVMFNITYPPCSSQNDRIGYAVAGIGDVNGDGRDDYVVGVPGYGSNNEGRVICYSGLTGQQLWSLTGAAGERLGQSLAAMGDANGDGRNDVVVGSPGYNNYSGRVRVLSGASGQILVTRSNSTANEEFGYSVAGIGDIDGDGDLEYAVGAPGTNSARGRVEIWSIIGGLMRTHNGAAVDDRFGYSVGGGFDTSGDGRPDYIVGAPYHDASGFNAGRAIVYSGASGNAIATLDGDGAYDYFGNSVTIVRSVGAGSFGNAVVGAPDYGSLFGSNGGTGYVRVFRHGGGLLAFSTLATYTGTTLGDRYGHAVAEAGDLDDDGYMDILIGALEDGIGASPAFGPGYVEVRSGRTGDVLYRKAGTSVGDEFGWAVARVGDTNGDGQIDLLVGAPFADIPCPNAGSYHVVRPIVPPSLNKVMITEVSTGDPDGVELTNFDSVYRSLDQWRLVWKDGSTLTSLPLGITMDPGETVIIAEPGAIFPEAPANVRVLSLLPIISSHSGDVAVALVNPMGMVVDEVRIAGATGEYAEGSLGGKFRGYVRNLQSGTNYPVNAERILGLDSNGGGDWTSGGPRSFGLENANSGVVGHDPLAVRRVVINEIDDSPDLIELKNSSGLSVDLQNWYLRISGRQNQAHAFFRPWFNSTTLDNDAYAVIGGIVAPPEKPANVPYFSVGITTNPLQLTTDEFECALYDAYGRCVDVVRTTGHDDNVVHNHPRSPSRWTDFTGAAGRDGSGEGSIGRNAVSTDTNTGSDFRPMATRTMGSANVTPANSWFPLGERELDARLNATTQGGGLALVLNAGTEHEGEKWTIAISFGHLQGQGPILGLGGDAIMNWQALSSAPPFFGFLDAQGTARLDFPAGTFPAGFAFDAIILLQDPMTGAFTTYTHVLEFDS